ncbi:MAG: hypothetical protein DWQ51_14395 [Microcystis wesenbergii TW10]|uniref:Uncharacterized protein n=1 Tax=Microcystis wesenbergii TW10 TaxID=2060474 RepID=A0A3E0LTH3_9CHRO|nr:MAG: hypothetical protein DWQ51_14395 [Microcystis wesenbergii TW10]
MKILQGNCEKAIDLIYLMMCGRLLNFGIASSGEGVMTSTAKAHCDYFLATIPNFSRVLSQKLTFITRKRVSQRNPFSLLRM